MEDSTLNQQDQIFYNGILCSLIIWDSLNPSTGQIRIMTINSKWETTVNIEELHN